MATSRRRRPRLQTCRRNLDGKCALCPEDRPSALQCHRLFPGAEGGKYLWQNTTTLCASCHARVTAGRIKFLAVRPSTFASRVALIRDEDDAGGKETWVTLPE